MNYYVPTSVAASRERECHREVKFLLFSYRGPARVISTGHAVPGARNAHVACATLLCCNSNIEMLFMSQALEVILQRRAIRVFEAIPIPETVRQQILDAARRALELQYATLPILLGGIPAGEKERGAALYGAEARGDGGGAHRGRGGHRIVGVDDARAVGMDAQERMQR